ncbi:hypothetical protein GGE45_003917 [Rhizobium aethiopicum]|uniref:relaxase/mobilization nuclease domain-containing protein n=1 Tax=Rhizobium aethiopicum TaxID=1138170 RepID=UPI00160E919C|nr:relaxase/mobilization nuclease domain-containing protein [Rhizobium aethiopicum]MBB4581569.1 hypothetical protein [Rhizobium aethiopicum]
MATCEALIKRIPKGGTRSVKALARQLGYLSRQNDDEREDVPLVGAQRHAFNPGGLDAIDPNDVWAFARRVYERSGRLPPDDPNGELDHDLTMHFVISFPEGTEPGAAEGAGRDWAEYVFGQGYRADQGHMQRHDYVTVFHNHGSDPDHPHPHVHVVVDRVPLGGGHLLTLHRGHPHWSYEAMRVQAVEAAANYGIELVATTRAERGLTERPMTDAQFRQFQRRLMQRPITQDEADRRRADAETVPHYDPYYDANGLAPDPNEIPDDPTRETVLQSCEPIMVPMPAGAAAAGGGGGPGGGGGGPGGTNQDDRRRRSPGPSLPSFGGGDDGDEGRSSGPGGGSGSGNEGLQVQSREEFEFDDDDDAVMNNGGGEDRLRQSEGSAGRAQPDGSGNGSEQQQPSQDNARKRKRTGEPSKQEPDQSETQQQQSRGSADRQQSELTSEALRQLNDQQATTIAAERIRDAERWLEGTLRADPPLEEDSRHLDNGPAAAPGPTSEAERTRDAQRRAERGRREREDRDTDDRRRKTPDQQARARKRRHEDDQSGSATKRARTDLAEAGPSAAAGGGNQPNGSQQPRNNDGQNSSRPAQPRNQVRERRQSANRRRQAALEALRSHRRTGGEAAGNMPQDWRERDRALLREARLALIEQRRAHAGTNLETRAQARARQAEEQRPEEHGQEANTNDRGAGRQDRPDPGSRSGNTRGR